MISGELEGIVLKDRTSNYRDGSRAGWVNVKDPSWYAREAWRFHRRQAANERFTEARASGGEAKRREGTTGPEFDA
jgi:hypothetical protein